VPKLVNRPPKYRHHKPSGQAVVTIHKRDHYLGPWRSKASKKEYGRLIAEFYARDRQPPPAGADELTCEELVAAYLRHAKAWYQKNGEVTTEYECIKGSLRTFRALYGGTLAKDFGPLALKAVRHDMEQVRARKEGGKQYRLSRGVINGRVNRIRRMFKWAASEQLLPVEVYQGLATIEGLRKGRTDAREPEAVKPVSDAAIQQTLNRLPAVVADMVQFQRLTGCRPTEVCIIRPIDVNRSGDVWEYRPQHHKTEHRGKERLVLIGPKAQDVLRPYLLREAETYCFRPCDSEKRRLAERRANRTTPIRPDEGKKRKKVRRRLTDRYNDDTYRNAVHNACDAAKVERWHPNQLRHTAATEIRRECGSAEAAQVILGHSRLNTTEIYAERDMSRAKQIMRQIG
jgi:integrase